MHPLLPYAATIFLSAFLLFLVQPVIAKEILPWFGGSAAVWTTCLVFFQVALLAGYAYSDFVVRRFAHRTQVVLHTALLLLSVAVLPIVPAAYWKPGGNDDPSTRILEMLAVTIGLPYFLLSTTSPLIQSWLARARPYASPYRLFALSNAASMLALLGYPVAFEPWAPTRAQALGWSIAYGTFAASCIATAWMSLRAAPRLAATSAFVPAVAQPAPATMQLPARKARRKQKKAAEVASAIVSTDAPPATSSQLRWVMLAATGTLLLLAVTNHITQNVASVPLLWIVPLAIYLLTFILCFEGRGWYRRNVVATLLGIALAIMGWVLADPAFEYWLLLHVGVFCTGLFLACMFCHGELALSKPEPKYLTRFYLMVASGGALGAALVGIVAPLVLPAFFELAGGLVLVACLLFWRMRRERIGLRAIAVASIVATVVGGAVSIQGFYKNTVVATRNFYGVLRVRETGSGNEFRRSLVSGSIQHGMQYPIRARYPTAYYVPTSGIGKLLSTRPGGFTPRRVGVIGLGIGTLAAYGLQGDIFRFYEINPEVFAIAQRDFSYLKDSLANVEFASGDARLVLESEPNREFDVLVVDAFLGDAIPMHLLTKEAIGVYLKHLKPGAVIAIHVSNRYMDLVPVVARLAQEHRLHAIYIVDKNSTGPSYQSEWILLSARRESLELPKLTESARGLSAAVDAPLWTDDFNNILQVLR